jgi:hypothetical protein
VASVWAAVLAEIYLCDLCACQEILSRNGRGQLPDLGKCAHFKKSRRWLRWSCCGKAFPCPICHVSAPRWEKALGKGPFGLRFFDARPFVASNIIYFAGGGHGVPGALWLPGGSVWHHGPPHDLRPVLARAGESKRLETARNRWLLSRCGHS